jgi:hypothetical protein
MNRFCFAVFLVLAARSAQAQVDPDVFPIDMVSPVLSQMMLENLLDDRRGQGRLPTNALDVTTYHASVAVSARVRRQYVDLIRKSVGPQAAQQYDEVLARNDPVRNWATLVADEGFHPGDVAEALASYWMLNYLIANGLSDGPSGSGRAVAQQVRGILARNSAFAGLSEAQRQELAELFMLNFLTQQAAYSEAVKTRDTDLKRRLGEAAVNRFRRELGIDLGTLTLTPQGFVRKG